MLNELLEEFSRLYKGPVDSLPADASALIILAGDRPPMKGESLSRVKLAANLLEKTGAPIPVIFSGVTEERQAAMLMMKEAGIPSEISSFQDCGGFGIANTKTQFEVFMEDPLTKGFDKAVFVTNVCYVPRVRRTAGKVLDPSVAYSVLGAPEDPSCNLFLKVMEEIDKIIRYSTKGDILGRPL